jgi:methylmalonyl-CoA mutase, C-terminal domain
VEWDNRLGERIIILVEFLNNLVECFNSLVEYIIFLTKNTNCLEACDFGGLLEIINHTAIFSLFLYPSMIRVLIAKVGLDGHDRGAKVIATSLKDAGMEVIYTGLRQTPDMVVTAAMQEDVDAIGVSILSGAHMTVFPKIITLMKERGMTNVLLTGGGIIPDDDMKTLQEMGVGKLFSPGTPTADIAAYIQEYVANKNIKL